MSKRRIFDWVHVQLLKPPKPPRKPRPVKPPKPPAWLRLRERTHLAWRKRYPKTAEVWIEFTDQALAAGFQVKYRVKFWHVELNGCPLIVRRVRNWCVATAEPFIRVQGLERPYALNVVLAPDGVTWLFVMPMAAFGKKNLVLTARLIEDARWWPTPTELVEAHEDAMEARRLLGMKDVKRLPTSGSGARLRGPDGALRKAALTSQTEEPGTART